MHVWSGCPAPRELLVAPKPRVVVFDYGFGNVRSCENSLIRAGADAVVSSDIESAGEADGLVVPGVGSFAACMAGLQSAGGDQVVADRIAMGRPVLGICVGMQIMFANGVEHGVDTAGLAMWPGTVERLSAPVLPHMGWNTVKAPSGSQLFSGATDDRFYFVHSYAVLNWSGSEIAQRTTAQHGENFVAAVEDGPLWATQFHPEKSGAAGARLLSNWIDEISK